MKRSGFGVRTVVLVTAVTGCASLAGGVYWKFGKRPGTELARPAAAAKDAGVAAPGLSDAARAYIWNVEDKAFQTSYKAGPALTAALVKGDESSLREFLAPDFEGEIFAPDAAEVVS